MNIAKYSIFTFGLVLSSVSFAVTPILNNTELFMRCYSQLTQTRISFNHPVLMAVQQGTKDPIVACIEIFDKARFNAQDRISVTTDLEAKAVLKVMHKFHASFFMYKDLPTIGGDQNESTRDIFDPETPAYYFTRALFRPNTDFKTVATLNVNLRSIRTDLDPALGPASNRTKAATIFGESIKFAPKGELLGIETTGLMNTPFSYLNASGAVTGNIEMGKHYGGGLLGSMPYLLTSLLRTPRFNSNGGNLLRGFSKSLFSDLLCRDLPVVRYVDAASFKDNASAFAYRKTQGCVQCHVSMDRAAAAVRGISYQNVGNAGIVNRSIGGSFVTLFQPTLGDGSAWPIVVDASYYKREPDGVFYFRNYKGDLVNIPVRGLSALGETIAAQNDFYLCAAKRYYSYFTGVNIQLEDPQKIGQLSDTDRVHQHNVETLANKLQQGQRLRDLVLDILKLPEYKKSSFGADR